MAVPKKKTSKSRRDMRRAHHALKAPGYMECQNCGDLKRAHHVCNACGHYAGKQIVTESVTAESESEAA